MKINIAHDLRKCLPFLLKADGDKLSEADTSRRISKVFEDVLGYNAITEIAHEVEVRTKYVDLVIRIDGIDKLFIEVKSADTKLMAHHVVQGETYASLASFQWVLLTNGIEWNLYHLTFSTKGVDFDAVFAVTLTEESVNACAEMIGLLHRASIKASDHEAYWKLLTALSPKSISRWLFSEHVIRFVRREIRRRYGIMVDVEDLASAIYGLFTVEAKERIGPPKIHFQKRNKKTSSLIDAAVQLQEPPPLPTAQAQEVKPC